MLHSQGRGDDLGPSHQGQMEVVVEENLGHLEVQQQQLDVQEEVSEHPLPQEEVVELQVPHQQEAQLPLLQHTCLRRD